MTFHCPWLKHGGAHLIDPRDGLQQDQQRLPWRQALEKLDFKTLYLRLEGFDMTEDFG
jgi:hypothetical protein